MASDVLPWLEYRWDFGYPVGMYRPILERLRGTPARAAALAAGVPSRRLTRRDGDRWSAQEHLGHLIAVERLWEVRISEYLAGAQRLTAADMGNRATESAVLNGQPIAALVATFAEARAATLVRLDPLALADAARVAHHPRLDRPMRLVDLCFFAAEHDDHHLAMARSLISA